VFGLFSAFTSGLRPQALTFDFGGLQLRVPRRDDFAAWATLRGQSRGFLQPWEPRWPEDDLTHAAFNRRVSRYYSEIRQDQGYPFFLIERASGVILGGLNLSHVRRRAAQSVTLGYWMGEDHAGKGYMSKAVPVLCRQAFTLLGFERVEAACLPENGASIRVLEKAGFRREGFARGYLSIAGARRDHLLFGLLKSDLDLV